MVPFGLSILGWERLPVNDRGQRGTGGSGWAVGVGM